MSSQSQPPQSSQGLPVELVEMLVEELPTPRALLNFACTSSLIHSIVFRKPLLYMVDARHHKRSMDDSMHTQPSLIHAIRKGSLDKIKTVLGIFQAETNTKLDAPWSLKRFPMPTGAAMRAGRLDALILLIQSGCWLSVLRDKSDDIRHLKRDYLNSWELRGNEFWSTVSLRPGVVCTSRNPDPYVLACIRGQEKIAIWLLENIYVPHRFLLWIAVRTKLSELVKHFSLDNLVLRDPLIHAALKLAFETNSVDWLGNGCKIPVIPWLSP
ncbi:hypothetical protein GGR51DRAFT_557092 [Nemania sp. FL0031]|nr:hypothetical protein GGR51DRAFT_557092 [Nemania sp. FL0031]